MVASQGLNGMGLGFCTPIVGSSFHAITFYEGASTTTPWLPMHVYGDIGFVEDGATIPCDEGGANPIRRRPSPSPPSPSRPRSTAPPTPTTPT